jgi:hypothetical protein
LNTSDNHLIRFLIASVLYFDLPMRPAHAELASTISITGAGRAESARLKLERYLEREDVRAGFAQNGVRPAATKAHVDALSDEVVAAIAGRIDTLEAGGKFIGALVFLFDLLLLTDLLGLTKVYSFTRSVTK